MNRRQFLGKCRLLLASPLLPAIGACDSVSDDRSSYFIRQDGSATDWRDAFSPYKTNTSADLAFLHANALNLQAGDSLHLSSLGGNFQWTESVAGITAILHVQGNELMYSTVPGDTITIDIPSGSKGIEINPNAVDCILDLTDFRFIRTGGLSQTIHAANNARATLINVTIVGSGHAPDGDAVSTDGDAILTLTGTTDIRNVRNGISTSEQALTTHGTSHMIVQGRIFLVGNNITMAAVNDSFMTIKCSGIIGPSELPGRATLQNGSTGTTLIEATDETLIADAGNDVLFHTVLTSSSLICNRLSYVNVSNTALNTISGTLVIDGGTFDGIPQIRLGKPTANIEIKSGTVFEGGGSNELIWPGSSGASAQCRAIVKLNGYNSQLLNYGNGKFDVSKTSISGLVIDCSQGAGWVRSGEGLFVLNNVDTLIHNIIIIGQRGTSMGSWLFDILQDGCRFHNIILHDVELTDTDGDIFRDSGLNTPTAEFSHFIFSGSTRTSTQTADQLVSDSRFPNSQLTTYNATDPANNDYTPTDRSLLTGGYDGANLPSTIELQDVSLTRTAGDVPFGAYKGSLP